MYYHKNASRTSTKTTVKKVVSASQSSLWIPKETVKVSGLTVSMTESALAIPKANSLLTMVQNINASIESICIEASSFPQGQPLLAKEFLNKELERIDQKYQEELDQVEELKTANQITKWAVGSVATVVSIVGTPAAGAMVSGIGAIATGGADLVIAELEKGIQKGEVSPDILDQIGYIAKDQYFFDRYREEFQKLSKSELRTKIQRSYKAYEAILNIPTEYGEKLDKMLGSLPMYQQTDFVKRIENGRVFIAKRNQMEIILTVLCGLYEGNATNTDSNDGSNNENGDENGGGNKRLKVLALTALATVVGAYLL